MSDQDNYNDDFDPTLGDDMNDVTEPTFDQLAGDDVYDGSAVSDDAEPIDLPTEETTEAAEPVTTEPQIEVIGPRSRVFVVGGTRIPDSDSTREMSNEAVRESLKATFPEVANATIREREESGVSYVEFLAQPGKKG